MTKRFHAKAKQTGLCALSTVLISTAAALPSLPGQKRVKPKAKLPPHTQLILPRTPQVSAYNDHLERIPTSYLIAGFRSGSEGKINYTDLSGSVILTAPIPKTTMVGAHSLISVSAGGASHLNTTQSALP